MGCNQGEIGERKSEEKGSSEDEERETRKRKRKDKGLKEARKKKAEEERKKTGSTRGLGLLGGWNSFRLWTSEKHGKKENTSTQSDASLF